MSLTIDTAPLGPSRAGRFNFHLNLPDRLLCLEPSPRKVRAVFSWHYPDPLPAVEPIRDLLAFYNERVELEVDGVA